MQKKTEVLFKINLSNIVCAKGNPAALGARMMGGGLGDCTIKLVKKDVINKLVEVMSVSYEKTMNKKLKAYILQIENGASKL